MDPASDPTNSPTCTQRFTHHANDLGTPMEVALPPLNGCFSSSLFKWMQWYKYLDSSLLFSLLLSCV